MDEWRELVIDRRSRPRILSDDDFRSWMERQRIFVSSCMNEELTPLREAVRTWIRSWGATPVMWEEIAPKDRKAESAYLEGVDGSNFFLLILGSRYGVADSSGYSPTHKESNRAGNRNIPRLAFVKSDVEPEERDGRLNDWLASLRNEVSTGDFLDENQLITILEARLRELASEQEMPWIKIGRWVFPGRVSRRSSSSGVVLCLEGHVQDPIVRNEIARLGSGWGVTTADRLTWGHETVPVRVQQVEIEGHTLSADVVRLTLSLDEYRGESVYPVSYGNVGPEGQAELYARRAFFGERYESEDWTDMLGMATRPEDPTLPEVLEQYGASGWIAEGLIRLYVIEALIRKYGGRFRHLEVGPATGFGVRAKFAFEPESYSRVTVELEGTVPLP